MYEKIPATGITYSYYKIVLDENTNKGKWVPREYQSGGSSSDGFILEDLYKNTKYCAQEPTLFYDSGFHIYDASGTKFYPYVDLDIVDISYNTFKEVGTLYFRLLPKQDINNFYFSAIYLLFEEYNPYTQEFPQEYIEVDIYNTMSQQGSLNNGVWTPILEADYYAPKGQTFDPNKILQIKDITFANSGFYH